MKRLLTTLIAIVLLFTANSLAFAQTTTSQPTDETQQPTENTQTIDDTSKLFDVEIQVGTQSPWDHSVPLYIKFRSTITADNVEISWEAPSGITLKKKHPQFISVTTDGVYTYRADIKPKTSGTYSIAGNVTVWQYNTNYTSSASTGITFDENLLTKPLTSGYSGAVITRYIVIFLLVLIAGFGLFIGGKLSLKYLKEWLKPPE